MRRSIIFAITIADTFLLFRIFDFFAGNIAPKNTPAVKTVMELEAIRSAVDDYKKTNGHLPSLSSNVSFTKALTSRKQLSPYNSFPYYNAKPSELNSNQELIDVWGTPLKVCELDPDHVQIQSAGADKEWGTQDDLHQDLLP